MQVQIGNIVIYVNHKGEELAAIVVDVHFTDTVSLCVFQKKQEETVSFIELVDYSQPDYLGAVMSNTWHWPKPQPLVLA